MAGASNMCGREPSEAEALADTTGIVGRSSNDNSSEAEAMVFTTGIVGRSSREVPPVPVSNVQPIAGFSAMASRLFSTPTKSNATRGPVVTDPQPKLRQLSLRASLQLDPPEAPSTPEKPKRQYKARGTGGTFGGKRPPKSLRLKAAFEQQRHEHQAELQAKKAKQPSSYTDRAYHKFVKEMLPLETEGSARDRFRKVVQKWKSQTASGPSAAVAEEAMVRAADNKSVM